MFRLLASRTMVRRPATAVARMVVASPVLFLALYRSLVPSMISAASYCPLDVNDTNRPSVPASVTASLGSP